MDNAVTPNLKDGGVETKPFDPTSTKVNLVIDALKAEAILPLSHEPPCWIGGKAPKPAREIIACENVLLHVPTGRLLPHRADFFTVNALPFAYDYRAPEPKEWLGFLDDLWGDDTESIGTLQEIFGYVLTHDTRQQKLFLIVGPKRSGKGTIARILTALVGKANVAGPTLAGLGSNFGLQPLINKQLAIISDARLGGRTDQHVIAERLLSISGEDSLTVDRKHREPWTGRLPVRFLVLTNEMPRIADASGALASRFVVLMLTKSFYDDEDLGLPDRLLKELPHILNWALDGLDRLLERGHFVTPTSSQEAVREFEDLGSPIGAFVRDRCVVGSDQRVEVSDLFDEWRNWCEEQGRSHPSTLQTFGRDLHAAIPTLRTRQGSYGRFYEGVDLQ